MDKKGRFRSATN